MAAYDLEEQEQLATMKAWWEKYGNLVSTVALVIAASLLAWLGWQQYQHSQSSQATTIYTEMFVAAQANDIGKLEQAANVLTRDYSGQLQASLGALLAARFDMDKGDSKSARVKLTWVVDNCKDPLVKDIARLRLAALLTDAKELDAALKTLDGSSTTEFATRFAEARGDVLVEQGKTVEAKQAYKQALDSFVGKPDDGASLKSLIETKLEALGGN